MIASNFLVLLFYSSTLVMLIQARHSGDVNKDISPGPHNSKVQVSDCVWRRGDDLTFPTTNPPLILDTETGIIVLPKKDQNNNNIYSVSTGTVLAVSCSANLCIEDNFFFEDYKDKKGKLRHTLVKCDNGKLKYFVNNQLGEKFDLFEADCQNEIRESILYKGSCKLSQNNNGGTQYTIGFHSINRQNNPHFYPVYDICLDKDKERTIWAGYILRGASILAGDATTERDFKSYIPSDIQIFTLEKSSMDDIYKQEWEKKIFEDANGNSIIQSNTKMFQRGHLATLSHFITENDMFATNQYINVLPMWGEINTGNWKTIETSLKSKATKAGNEVDMIIYVGGHQEPLEYLNVAKYLADSKILTSGHEAIPIPSSMWKIVYVPTKQQGVAFLTSNNFEGKFMDPKPSTASECTKLTGWLNLNSSPSKGSTTCHTIKDFIATFGNILPDDSGVNIKNDALLV